MLLFFLFHIFSRCSMHQNIKRFTYILKGKKNVIYIRKYSRKTPEIKCIYLLSWYGVISSYRVTQDSFRKSFRYILGSMWIDILQFPMYPFGCNLLFVPEKSLERNRDRKVQFYLLDSRRTKEGIEQHVLL